MYDTTVSTEEVQNAEMLILWGDTWDFVRVPTNKSNSRITCGTLLEIWIKFVSDLLVTYVLRVTIQPVVFQTLF